VVTLLEDVQKLERKEYKSNSRSLGVSPATITNDDPSATIPSSTDQPLWAPSQQYYPLRIPSREYSSTKASSVRVSASTAHILRPRLQQHATKYLILRFREALKTIATKLSWEGSANIAGGFRMHEVRVEAKIVCITDDQSLRVDGNRRLETSESFSYAYRSQWQAQAAVPPSRYIPCP
jgi:hypothetical protein